MCRPRHGMDKSTVPSTHGRTPALKRSEQTRAVACAIPPPPALTNYYHIRSAGLVIYMYMICAHNKNN